MGLRVLCVTSMYPPQHLGGYEVSCRDVMERLARRGDEVVVLTSDLRLNDLPEPAAEPAVRVHRSLRLYFDGTDLVEPPRRTCLDVERTNQRAVAAAVAEARPDVIAVWQVAALGLGALEALHATGVPMVFVVCDDWLTYAPGMDPWLRSTDRLGPLRSALERWSGIPCRIPDISGFGPFLFISDTVRRSAATRSRWQPRESAIVYSGVDTSLFSSAPDGDLRPWGGQLLYVGRFDRRKGIETLIRAMATLPDERLVVSGTGDPSYEAELRSLVDRLHLGERITIARHDRAELPELYRAADAVVFPSEWAEPFGLVPVEAMASGVPVVASGTGGSGEFLVHGVNALIHRPGEPASIAAAVRQLSADASLRSHLVDGGRRTADELDVEVLTDEIQRWHAHVVGQGPRPDDRRLAASAAVQHPAADDRIDPFARHAHQTAQVLKEGSAAAIKRLYVDLGSDLADAFEHDTAAVPVLSAPETAPAVLGLLEPVGRILDAGCGPNPVASIHAASKGATVVSLDIGHGTLRLARAVAEREGLRLLPVVADVERLPFPADTFAGVVCDDTIEHLPDDSAGVAELGRVVVPGGQMILATPNRWNARIIRAKVRDRRRGLRRPASSYYLVASHLREYTWGEFGQLLAPAARVRSRTGVGWSGGRKARLASALVRRGPLRRFSQMIVIEAEPRADGLR